LRDELGGFLQLPAWDGARALELSLPGDSLEARPPDPCSTAIVLSRDYGA